MYGVVCRLWVGFIGEPQNSMAVLSLNQGESIPDVGIMEH